MSATERLRALSWRDQPNDSDEDEEAGIVDGGRREWYPGPKAKAKRAAKRTAKTTTAPWRARGRISMKFLELWANNKWEEEDKPGKTEVMEAWEKKKEEEEEEEEKAKEKEKEKGEASSSSKPKEKEKGAPPQKKMKSVLAP